MMVVDRVSSGWIWDTVRLVLRFRIAEASEWLEDIQPDAEAVGGVI